MAHNEDEDELGVSGYYNFDNGYVKPEDLAIGRNKVSQQVNAV